MSAGQRRRLNLAVSQAFADIMAVSNGTRPSLVFLDEVTTNIDPMGVQGIYNMIQDLSKDKQVFVTTHDHDLLEMLENADTIKLVHEGGKTTIETITCKK
jgi:ABC-type multidrug transport system ATPase subunit